MSYIEELFSLKGKTALCVSHASSHHLLTITFPRITGGTRGIGARMALALSRAGADLILVQRNETNTTTKDMIARQGGQEGTGGRADIAVCDLADKADVARLIPRVTGEMGRTLDIVVNCGVYCTLPGRFWGGRESRNRADTARQAGSSVGIRSKTSRMRIGRKSSKSTSAQCSPSPATPVRAFPLSSFVSPAFLAESTLFSEATWPR